MKTIGFILGFTLLLLSFFLFKSNPSDSSVVYAQTQSVGIGSSTPTPTLGGTAPTATPTLTVTPTPKPDTSPPSVTITYPVNNQVITGGSLVTIAANASDNVAVSKVKFYQGAKLLCIDTTAVYTCNWYAPIPIPRKSRVYYTLTAKAFDSSGNTSSYSIRVKVTPH